MTICKQCGLPIQWKMEPGASHWQCFDLDGKIHWDTCSKARFEKIKATGEAFDYGDTKGYYTDLKSTGVQFTQETSGAVRGVNYHPSGQCKECVAPFEVCATCPDKLEKQHEEIIPTTQNLF